MFLYIVFGLVFFAVFLLILLMGLPAILKKKPRGNLEKLNYYESYSKKENPSPTFYDRMVMPVFTKIFSRIKRILPGNVVESVKNKLELAGVQDKMRVDVFLAFKFFLPVIFFFVIIFSMLFFNPPMIMKLILILLIPVSYLFPDYNLKSKISKRQDEIRRNLPNALDLLTISVEAGLGFDIALYKVSESIKGTLGEEFKRVIKEMEIGFSRKDALRNLSKRTDVADLNSFIFSMIQADIFGISIGKVLRIQAAEMRVRRRQLAEEKGIKAPVKLVFPTILCLFPALMAIVLAPAAIRIYNTLLQNVFK
ncbi:MAG: type II secretion system F family protein [Actinobacteria bacterium]|nr:type II secretion system F family protein [Actinomycetota bacterium]